MVAQTDESINPGVGFAARWACYFYCILAAAERLAAVELDQCQRLYIFGLAIENEWLLHSNYKNHVRLLTRTKDWGTKSDPEYHFYVMNAGKILAAALDILGYDGKLPRVFKKDKAEGEYQIQQHRNNGGSHFILFKNGKLLYNPDERIKPSSSVMSYRNVVLA